MKTLLTPIWVLGLAAATFAASEFGLAPAVESAASGDVSGVVGCAGDHDSDGICDPEDPDDDNDGFADSVDNCPMGSINWFPNPVVNDHDMDGCRDDGANDEDTDEDNDTEPDITDSCPRGVVGWVPTSSSDNDFDGCRDSDEDTDDDNDGVLDSQDNCPLVPNPGQEDSNGDGVGDACTPVGTQPTTWGAIKALYR